LITGRRHLNEVLRTFAEHYNRARPHRSLDLLISDLLSPPVDEPVPLGGLVRTDRLGGLIHEYERAA
jgi:putative transposase